MLHKVEAQKSTGHWIKTSKAVLKSFELFRTNYGEESLTSGLVFGPGCWEKKYFLEVHLTGRSVSVEKMDLVMEGYVSGEMEFELNLLWDMEQVVLHEISVV